MLRPFALVLLLLCHAVPVWAQSVAFINPGRSNEAYWVAAAEAMAQASKSLGMSLEVRYAERDHLKALDIARELAERPQAERPEYVVVSNDYATGGEILRLLNGSGIQVLMAFSGIHGADRRLTGGPRENYPFWLGSLEPRAEDAGYLTAKTLIDKGRSAGLQASDGRLHLLAIAGDRSTPSSSARNSGMQRAVSESRDVVLDQLVYAGWSLEKAALKADWLFARHASARLVWAGSDQMAFGAMQVWRRRGGTPGKDALFSGINTSVQAMQAIERGELSALAGGHFMAGAWAMVLIHDHAHGHDFVDEGLEQVVPMFILFDDALAQRFLQRFSGRSAPLDFCQYSKACNPKLKEYDFNFVNLLR